MNWKGLGKMLMVAGLMLSIGCGMGEPVVAVIGAVAFVVALFAPAIPGMDGVTAFGVQREIWEKDIKENLFKNNEFLTRSLDMSQYVLEGKVVHIPQAGANPAIAKNRNSLPASVSQRTDTDITYTLDQYTSDPFLINAAETYELSYNKRMSVLGQHLNTMNQYLADNLLINWVTTGVTVLRTTGDAKASALNNTVVGQRKKMKAADLRRAMKTLNLQNVPMNDRICLLSAEMYNDLLEDLEKTNYRDFSAAMDPKTGVIGRLYGFDLYQRSQVAVFDNSATPVVKAYGAADAADDNDVAICWQADCVERATGSVLYRERLNDPTYYGDVYSIEVRMGGRNNRGDYKGVVAIVEDVPQLN